MKLAVAFLLGMVAMVAIQGKTADDWAVATVGSQHLTGDTYCEFNPGVGIESGIWIAGVYRNSLCEKTSAYLGTRWRALERGSLSLNFAGMAVTGYEAAVTLGAALVLSYEGKENGVNLVWFPSKKGDLLNGVIALQLKRRF